MTVEQSLASETQERSRWRDLCLRRAGAELVARGPHPDAADPSVFAGHPRRVAPHKIEFRNSKDLFYLFLHFDGQI
jgi:hypothetical protein